MVHAFITSRLDYCNALYGGLPKCLIDKLGRVQRTAARLISNTRKYDHITPVMVSLHWLPIQERINFKILLLAYKALHGLAPDYLSGMLHRRVQRGTRSDQLDLLNVPKSKTGFGDRTFQCLAPTLWNSVPLSVCEAPSVDCFKRHLKTFLFRQAYGQSSWIMFTLYPLFLQFSRTTDICDFIIYLLCIFLIASVFDVTSVLKGRTLWLSC